MGKYIVKKNKVKILTNKAGTTVKVQPDTKYSIYWEDKKKGQLIEIFKTCTYFLDSQAIAERAAEALNKGKIVLPLNI